MPWTERLVSWLRAEDGLASVLLLLSQAVFLCVFFSIPENSTLSGCGSGRDMKQWLALHCLATAWHFFLFLSLCVIATGATNFTFLPHSVSLGVAQCQSIVFSLALWQCYQGITWETLFIPPCRVNAGGILKRNKVRDPLTGSDTSSLSLCWFFLWDIS